MSKHRRPGRPSEIGGGARYMQVILDKARLEELCEIYPNKSTSQMLRDLVEDELERKNSEGSDNPIRVRYDDPPANPINLLLYMDIFD